MYKLSKDERETIILWSMENNTAKVDTADPRVQTKLDKLVKSNPESYTCTRTDPAYGAKEYTIASWRYITFRKPASQAKREAAQRNALAMRSKQASTLNSEGSTSEDE